MGPTAILLLSITTFLATLLVVLSLPALVYRPAVAYVQRWQASTQQQLDDLSIYTVTATEGLWLVAAAVVVTGIVVFVVSGSLLIALTLAGVVLVTPKLGLDYMRRNRRRKFEEQLPAVLEHIASSTQAGLTLIQAFEEVSQHMSAPASEEFRLMTHHYRLGKELKGCIRAMKQRLNSRPFNLVASAMMIHLEKGGNLSEAMSTMSASLKEIWRLEQKMRTASAEGRKAVKLISGMPLVIFLMVALTQPDIIETLTASPIGWVFITVAVALYACALWWLRKLLTKDV